jgi:glycine hydroxymethyltransferase
VAGITTNKNMIFQDNRTAGDPSGIRIGTAAMTSKGYKTNDFKKIAKKIIDTLSQ